VGEGEGEGEGVAEGIGVGVMDVGGAIGGGLGLKGDAPPSSDCMVGRQAPRCMHAMTRMPIFRRVFAVDMIPLVKTILLLLSIFVK